MHRFAFLVSLIVLTLPVLAPAQKNDCLWPLGLGPGWSDFNFFFDFNTDPPSISKTRKDSMSTGVFAASYCNDAGEILAYSNGLWVLNKHGQLIENAFGLNPTLAQGQTQGSYLGNDSGFFIAQPGDSNIIHLIHLDYGYHPAGISPYRYVGRHLLRTTIDLAANNGAGKAIVTNQLLLDGVLMTAAAVRHANGRDWWIMCSDADENRHYRFLLDPTGFEGPYTQEIGTKPNPVGRNNSGFGNTFSPNGRYYVDNNSYFGFSVFEFDRCTGLLGSEKRVNWPDEVPPAQVELDNWQYRPGGGIVFSPDERLLYVTATYDLSPWQGVPFGQMPFLFQFEMAASDLYATIDTINPIDTLKFYPYGLESEVMYGAETGPDGRIYVVHSGNAFCTVQYPNVRGKGCGFRYYNPNFQNVIGQAMMVLPNYRLGPLDDGPCDTLGLNNLPVANFRVDDTLPALARYFFDLSYKEPVKWSWTFGDGDFSQETSPVHKYAEPGKYQVCLSVSNANGSNTFCRTIFVGITAAHESWPEAQALEIYPNPATHSLQVLVQGSSDNGLLSVTDLLGRRLVSQTISPGSPITLDVHNYPRGVYLVLLETSTGKRCTQKLMVQ